MDLGNQRSLADWLLWLEKLHPKNIDLGLERVSRLAQQLQLYPFPHFTITVAGTNGKGSCVALLEAILSAQGYQVGAYTSPHILNFNERIRLRGNFCTEAELCAAMQIVELARGNISLTYFEFTTLTALLLFQQAELDMVILEVGMGGRLDAVNCIDADIAVITSIDFDHIEWLGDTREAIGHEKAGIMRRQKPVIYGEHHMPVSISQTAQRLSAPIYQLDQDYYYQQSATCWQWWNSKHEWQDLPLPKLALQNAAMALQVISLLPPQLAVSDVAIKQGLHQANQPGRWHVLPGDVTKILDVAHNPAAARWLAKRLQAHQCTGSTYAVVAMLAEKDSYHTLAALLPIIDQWYVASLPVSRGGHYKQLAQALSQSGRAYYKQYDTVQQAYQQALADAVKGDRIIVFGSFYTVADVLRAEGVTHVEWR